MQPKHIRLSAQLVRGAVSIGGLNILSMLLVMVSSILMARGLGPDNYGQYAFVITVISLLSLPFGRGLGQFVTREVAKCHYEENWALLRGLLRRTNQLVIAGSALIVLSLVLISVTNAQWHTDDRWTLFIVASLLVILHGLNAIRSSTLRGLRYVAYSQLPDLLVRPSLHLIIVFGLLIIGVLNPASALASQVISTAAAFIIGAWLLSNRLPPILQVAKPCYRNREWIRSLIPFTLLNAVSQLNSEMGTLANGLFGTNEDVAILRVALNLTLLVSLSLSIVNQVIAPHITRAYHDNDIRRLRQLSRQSARAAITAALPVALLLMFYGKPIIQVIYGDAYADSSVLPLAILAGGQLANVAFNSAGLFLAMCGFERDTMKGHLVALVLITATAVIFVPFLGATGAALSVIVGLIASNGVLIVLFVRRFGFRPGVL